MSRDERNERIVGLWPAIQAKATYLSTRCGDVDADEVASELSLAILEQAERDPHFLDQQQTYILNLAAWRWQDAQKRFTGHRHGRAVNPVKVAVSLDTPVAPGADDTLADLIPADQCPLLSDIEHAETSAALRAAISHLPDNVRRVVVGVYGQDKTQRALAAEMGRNESTVRYWATQGRRALASELAGSL